MIKKRKRGVARLWAAWKCSLAGLRLAWQHEPSFRQETALLLVLAPLGWRLGATAAERALLIGSLLLVPCIELLNSAVEAIVDRMGEEIHPLAGRAKDMGSAAVLLTMVHAVVVWVLIVIL